MLGDRDAILPNLQTNPAAANAIAAGCASMRPCPGKMRQRLKRGSSML